jgi:hypothetical protein
VHFSLPKKDYVIFRKSFLNGSNVTPNQTPDYHTEGNSVFVDNTVKAGEDYIYSFGTKKNSVYAEEAAITVSIPVDIQIEKNSQWIVDPNNSKQIASLSRIRRLVLSDGSALITNGQDLTIKIRELYSYGGKILSFGNGSIAPENTNGASGGNLSLFAIKAEGDLEIRLNGQQGGNGTKGTVATQNTRGGNGTPGRQGGNGGEIRTSIQESYKLNLNLSIQGGARGEGGPPGDGKNWSELICIDYMISTNDPSLKITKETNCRNQERTTPGGSPGAPGTPGIPGKICEAINTNEAELTNPNNYRCR